MVLFVLYELWLERLNHSKFVCFSQRWILLYCVQCHIFLTSSFTKYELNTDPFYIHLYLFSSFKLLSLSVYIHITERSTISFNFKQVKYQHLLINTNIKCRWMNHNWLDDSITMVLFIKQWAKVANSSLR